MTTPAVTVNGKSYAPSDPVSWDDAIAHEGSYFERCRYLGLPQPPAAMFAPEDENPARDMERSRANVRYHQKFLAAEEQASARMETRDDWEKYP